MKKKNFYAVLCFLLICFSSFSKVTESGLKKSEIKKNAKQVIERVFEGQLKKIEIKVIEPENQNDVYIYQCKEGNLIVEGSSVSAISRGVYDYLQSQSFGMFDHSGPEFRIPQYLPNAPKTKVVSPYQIRHAHNAVTSGYTTPYWTFERWEEELDWQAMHGFNMIMAPNASEAIMTRVYKKLGLTKEEIDEFYTGPAHLPWSRMGSVCGVGGSLPDHWHETQIALQHKLLDRMKELQIDPVIQGFNGFLPKALKRFYPETVFHETLWNAGFPEKQRPWLIMPDSELFAKITKMFMKEWQKEFGDAKYYLVDSFNELQLPKTEKSETEMLADYGEKTYNVIKAGDPDAIWVIQGWMFTYQKDIWNQENVKALFSKVPDDQILILDYANNYGNTWEPMNAFNGKQWAYGFVQNMGARTMYTGNLKLFSAGSARALHSPDKKNLVGFTIEGEGLENNYVPYELLTEVAWSNDSIDLQNWLEKYCLNRYGKGPFNIIQSWRLMSESCYQILQPRPHLGWQLGRCEERIINYGDKFNLAVKLFLEARQSFDNSKNYEDDAIEMASLLLGIKADEWFVAAKKFYEAEDIEKGDQASQRALELLDEIDHLSESHSLNRLDRWIEFAKSHTNDSELNAFYEQNARHIITVWGPPVNDYSARIWSGLIRDFYKKRMELVMNSLKTKKEFNRKEWEWNWVTSQGISNIAPYENPLDEAYKFVVKAIDEEVPDIKSN